MEEKNQPQDKNFYSKAELEEFEKIIDEKLEESRKEYKQLAKSLRESTGSSADSYNFTEYGNESREKEQTEILMARQQKFIVGLENALIRIKNGTYGICRVTGKLISKERLRIVPHTTTSIEAKRKQNDQPRNF